MSLTLKSFSQDVDMEDPQKVLYFLVFRRDVDGKELRLPVQKETTERLVDFLYGSTKLAAASQAPQREAEEEVEEDLEDVTQDRFVPDDEEEEGATYYGESRDDSPNSEDEVPSL